MTEKEVIELVNDAYKQGFCDGFEYGSGKQSPYAQGGVVKQPFEPITRPL